MDRLNDATWRGSLAAQVNEFRAVIKPMLRYYIIQSFVHLQQHMHVKRNWKTTDRQKIKSNFSSFLGFIFESMTSALPSPEDLEQRKFIESFSVFHSNVTMIVIDFINRFSNFTELFLLAITNNSLQRLLFMCFLLQLLFRTDSNFLIHASETFSIQRSWFFEID